MATNVSILSLKALFSNQFPSFEKNSMGRYFKFYEDRITAGIIIALFSFVVFFVIEVFKQ